MLIRSREGRAVVQKHEGAFSRIVRERTGGRDRFSSDFNVWKEVVPLR